MKPAEKPKEEPKPEAGEKPAADEKPAEEPAGEKPAADDAEDKPADDGEGTKPPAEDDEEKPEVDDEGEDGQVTPVKANKARLTLKEDDKVGRLAASFKHRNRDWTLEQCVDAAKNQLGIKPSQEKPGAEDKKPDPNADLPQTVEAIDTAAETLQSERDQAFAELKFDEVAKMDRQLRRLDRHRLTVERDTQAKAQQAVTAYETNFAASEKRAVELYDFAGKPDSPMGKRMAEIEEALKEAEDPLYYSPDKPLKIAQMVATENNIAPRKKGAPAAVKPAAKPAEKPAEPKKGILPGGDSRTTQPVAGQKTGVEADIPKISGMSDLRSAYKKLGLRI